MTMEPTPSVSARAAGLRLVPAWPFWLALVGVSLAALYWRLACIQLGPDPDTDAYGHFVIARQLAETPFNLKVHWVWLPLYHALLAIPVLLGATLDQVRGANAVLAFAPALVWCWALARSLRPASRLEQALPFMAGLLVAGSPLLLQLGTTGQMEVVFCLLLCVAVALLSRERFGAASLVLGALVLTRYEGWAVSAVIGAELLRRRVHSGTRLGKGGIACLFVPPGCVLVWATLRWAGGEPWLGFLFDNQAFAERVLDQHAPGYGLLEALARYTVTAPYRAFGLALVFAPLGITRCAAKNGVWFVAPGLAIVGFLTLSSLTRSQLGLDRHFLSVVPFAAAWVAHGMLRASEWLGDEVERRFGERLAPRQARLRLVLVSACHLAVLVGALSRLGPSLRDWTETTRGALKDVRALAASLREAAPTAVIVCHEAAVEVLSGLDPARFMRGHLDPHGVARVHELAKAQDVYVVDRARQLDAFMQAGRISYGAPGGPPDALMALHFSAASAGLAPQHN